MIDLRICAFCKGQDIVYQNGLYQLFHYATRRYAHAECLCREKGEEGLALLPTHMLEAMPWKVLKQHGLLGAAERLLALPAKGAGARAQSGG